MTFLKFTFLSILSLFFINPASSQINEAIKFKITDPFGNTDETIIRFSDEASNAFDPMWDAWKLFAFNDNVPSLYSESDQTEPLTINAIPKMTQDTTIFLQMRARINGGSYLMETEQLGSFPTNVKIAIRDLITGDVFELNQNQSFNFDVAINPTEDFERFEVFYSTIAQVAIDENDVTFTNAGCNNWDFELTDNALTLIEINDVSEDNYLMESLSIGDYNLIVTDEFNLKDTIHFTINFEEDGFDDESEQDMNSVTDKSILANCSIINAGETYYLDLSHTNIEDVLFVDIYALNGQIIGQFIYESNTNDLLQLPQKSFPYVVVLRYRDNIKTQQVVSL